MRYHTAGIERTSKKIMAICYYIVKSLDVLEIARSQDSYEVYRRNQQLCVDCHF